MNFPFRKPSPFLRLLRNLAILAFLLALFVETLGVPHLRLSQSYRQHGTTRVFLHNRYWSPLGTRTVDPARHGGTLPLLVLIPLDESLLTIGGRWVVQTVKNHSNR